MKYLFLDTSDHLILGVLDKDFSWISYKDTDLKKSSKDVHALIYSELEQAGTDIKNIAALLQVSGPGSYTGMRVSEGIANILHWQKIPVHSFYHFEVPRIIGEYRGLWFANAFKKEIFCYTFEEENSINKLYTKEQFLSFANKYENKIYSNFRSDLYDNCLLTSTMIKENPEKVFSYVVGRNKHLGPYYYRSVQEEFRQR